MHRLFAEGGQSAKLMMLVRLQHGALSLCRTMVVQLPVKEKVGGSSPSVGAGM